MIGKKKEKLPPIQKTQWNSPRTFNVGPVATFNACLCLGKSRVWSSLVLRLHCLLLYPAYGNTRMVPAPLPIPFHHTQVPMLGNQNSCSQSQTLPALTHLHIWSCLGDGGTRKCSPGTGCTMGDLVGCGLLGTDRSISIRVLILTSEC